MQPCSMGTIRTHLNANETRGFQFMLRHLVSTWAVQKALSNSQAQILEAQRGRNLLNASIMLCVLVPGSTLIPLLVSKAQHVYSY